MNYYEVTTRKCSVREVQVCSESSFEHTLKWEVIPVKALLNCCGSSFRKHLR